MTSVAAREGRDEMGDPVRDVERKPATAARIYDYHLGGMHNFPADRAAAQAIAAKFPLVPAIARTNRAFLRRAVRHLIGAGVRQFLDIGSGIPTAGNVHEIARELAPDARVVYVDIDPVAVAESLEILEGDDHCAAIQGDIQKPSAILDHPRVRGLLDFEQPVGLLLLAVLHFVTDDDVANDAVGQLLAAVAPGSHLVISHATPEDPDIDKDHLKETEDLYRSRTATPLRLRNRAEVERLFNGLELVDPGLVWLPRWRPEPDDPTDFANDPWHCGGLAAVGRLS